jgi:hypothetical protein
MWRRVHMGQPRCQPSLAAKRWSDFNRLGKLQVCPTMAGVQRVLGWGVST